AATAIAAAAAARKVMAEPPDGWRFVTVRDETAARSSARRDDGSVGLVFTGNNSPLCDGRWVKRVPLPPGQYVRFTARFRDNGNVEMLGRNVLATLVWTDENGKEIGNADYASTTAPANAQGWRPVDATFPVPAKAKSGADGIAPALVPRRRGR